MFTTPVDDKASELPDYELSWKLRDRDNAAGFACNTEEASTTWFFSSLLDWKAFKSTPLPAELEASFLIPSVAQIELFAASPGSSILNVFGIHKDLSGLASFGSSSVESFGFPIFSSLECFPKVGELGAELVALWFGEVGWATQGMFHAPGTLQLQ